MTASGDLYTNPPPAPICRAAPDSLEPCRFAGVCHEARQRLQSGQVKTASGRWMTIASPRWGHDCWAFQHLGDVAAREEVTAEREGMKAE